MIGAGWQAMLTPIYYERGVVDMQVHRNVMAARRQFRAKNGS